MKYILAFLCLCGFLKSHAQKSSIPFINTEITVDGQFNEAVWQQLPNVYKLLQLFTNRYWTSRKSNRSKTHP